MTSNSTTGTTRLYPAGWSDYVTYTTPYTTPTMTTTGWVTTTTGTTSTNRLTITSSPQGTISRRDIAVVGEEQAEPALKASIPKEDDKIEESEEFLKYLESLKVIE